MPKPLNEILLQLNEANDNLSRIAIALEQKSFWDSNLFAACIGFAAALLVLFIERIFVYWDRKNKEEKELFEWLSHQFGRWSTGYLSAEAARSNWPEADATAPKDTGEKMVTILRMEVKHWAFTSKKVRNLFMKYEEELRKISAQKSNQQNAETIKDAQKVYDEIENLVSRKTGETPWTSR